MQTKFNMSQSTLGNAIAAVEQCSTDELRQLQALISVRIGEGYTGKTRVASKGKPGSKRGKAPEAKRKGNPERKSQFATHPLYKAYRSLKKELEAKCKAEKISFKDAAGTELRTRYDEALLAWSQAKSGFRRSASDDKGSGSKPGELAQAQGARVDDIVPYSSQGENVSPSQEPPSKRKRVPGEPAGGDSWVAVVKDRKPPPSEGAVRFADAKPAAVRRSGKQTSSAPDGDAKMEG
jgi:hypothetical protein